MGTDLLDPVIHAATRLRIVATLAALPDGDALAFTRLQEILDLTPGNLITHLRKLEDADYGHPEPVGREQDVGVRVPRRRLEPVGGQLDQQPERVGEVDRIHEPPVLDTAVPDPALIEPVDGLGERRL
jgi:DNA-binding transcriptional ArsR family regulator